MDRTVLLGAQPILLKGCRFSAGIVLNGEGDLEDVVEQRKKRTQ